MQFKTESFIVLFNIAWTYLLHAYYRDKKIDYRYYDISNIRKKFHKNADGSVKHWDLTKCILEPNCPLDIHTINNLKFLIGLRNQIEHRKANGLDSFLSARYQACALNFNFYIKVFFGEKYSLDKFLALTLQFAALDYNQVQTIKDKDGFIPKSVQNYIATFDNNLSEDEIKNERFSYHLLFVKVDAKRKGKADRVIEFIDPNLPLAKGIEKEYWVKEDREKPKFLPSEVVQKIKEAGYKNFGIRQHTDFWRTKAGKNPSKGYGTKVAKTWYWYENWIDFILSKQ